MNKAVLLDRDGTINQDSGYVCKIEDFVFLPDVLEALKLIQKSGFLLVIITNQSGIGRGYYSEEEYKQLTNWMINRLAQEGVSIADAYYCPHHPMGTVRRYAIKCECRKPGIALFYRAIKELHIKLEGSFAIGDNIRDLAVCENTSVKGILLSDDHISCEEMEKKILLFVRIYLKRLNILLVQIRLMKNTNISGK